MTVKRYLLWRTALLRHGIGPWSLTAQVLAEVAAQAGREHQVIRLALATPEAAAIKADSDVIAAALAQFAGRYPDRETFRRELASSGLQEQELAEAIGAELRAGLALDRIGEVAVDESAVRAFYEQRRGRMVVPERRTARHILITLNEEFEENHRARAAERLREAAARIDAGAAFADVALQVSECPTALQGGLLGELRRGQLYPELDAALFAMPPGGLRQVESPLGLHLLRCDAIIPPQPLSYEAAAPSIRRRLKALAREQTLKAWLHSFGDAAPAQG